MPGSFDQASPMMGGRPGLDANQAARQGCEEVDDLRALQLSSNSDLSRSVDAVNLEHALGEIETNGSNLRRGRLLFLWRLPTTTTSGTRCRSAGAVYPINFMG